MADLEAITVQKAGGQRRAREPATLALPIAAAGWPGGGSQAQVQDMFRMGRGTHTNPKR